MVHSLKGTGDSKYIYQNKLDKACLQHDMAYGDFKDLKRRTAADKFLRDKAFNIAKNLKYDGYQHGLASIVNNFFDKRTSDGLTKNEIVSNKELAEELHKPIIRKLDKRKVHSPFIGNIWGGDLADMQLASKFDKGFRCLLCTIDIYRKYAWVIPLKDKKEITKKAFSFLLCAIDIYSKYAWVIPLKDKKGIIFTNAFQKSWVKSQTK